jgi:hypothetical protein
VHNGKEKEKINNITLPYKNIIHSNDINIKKCKTVTNVNLKQILSLNVIISDGR